MATAPRIAIRAYRTLSGLPIPREDFPEASGQTFKQGAPVVLNSSGYLQECADNDPALILGFATRDGQNTTNNGDKSQTVELAHPGTLFIGNLDTSGSEGNGTTAASDRGKMYGVKKSSVAGKWYVDKTETTNKRVVVWDFYDGAQDGANSAIGDTIQPVIFAVDPAYFQGNRTS